MEEEKPNLLDLFLICNTPSSNKYELFCRHLVNADGYLGGYFDNEDCKYFIPEEYQYDDFYGKGHYKYSRTENGTLLNAYNFGTYDTYEEAVSAADNYTEEELLEKFFAIHKEAVALLEQHDLDDKLRQKASEAT